MAETMVLYEFLSSFVESFRLTRCHRPGYDTLSLTTGDELMASIRKRTWITAKGERSAWVVSYAHNGRQHLKTFKTKKAAVDWRAEMTVEKGRGIHTPASTSITVADAAARWLAQAQDDELEPSTIAGYEQAVRLHIAPFLGTVKLVDLTAAGIEDFRNRLRRKGARPRWRARLRHHLAASSRMR